MCLSHALLAFNTSSYIQAKCLLSLLIDKVVDTYIKINMIMKYSMQIHAEIAS